jgi:hypothetical protein
VNAGLNVTEESRSLNLYSWMPGNEGRYTGAVTSPGSSGSAPQADRRGCCTALCSWNVHRELFGDSV